MRLPLLARDYTQSFPNYKRSEDRTLRIGWGKPFVLISHCRNDTVVCAPHSIKMLLCVELTEESSSGRNSRSETVRSPHAAAVVPGELSMVLNTEAAHS